MQTVIKRARHHLASSLTRDKLHPNFMDCV